MRTIPVLFFILGLSFYAANVGAESYIDGKSYFMYEEVPVLDTEPTRIAIEDLVLHEGTPTYEGNILEEADFAAFEQVSIIHE